MTTEIRRDNRTWQFGVALFAGVIMVMVGTFDMIQGLVGIISKGVGTPVPKYVFAFNPQAWGWIHLILGLVLVGVGLGVVAGKAFAKVLGIIVVGLSAITNFMALPNYPIWSALMIAIEVVIIWALATYSAEQEVIQI